MHFNIEINCYASCASCSEIGNETEHKCQTCIDKAYLANGTSNCYYSLPQGYYLDSSQWKYYQCANNCYKISISVSYATTVILFLNHTQTMKTTQLVFLIVNCQFQGGSLMKMGHSLALKTIFVLLNTLAIERVINNAWKLVIVVKLNYHQS